MAELASRERLQPALLDRLTDDDTDNRQPEPREARLINKNRLRQAVSGSEGVSFTWSPEVAVYWAALPRNRAGTAL